ncbi:MAG TPA: carbohydrate ABC transporter permease [Acetobacteraceae bacterium]|nr:carbohydrate ABC transporter permease [Acetobacteraceae bacterium]
MSEVAEFNLAAATQAPVPGARRRRGGHVMILAAVLGLAWIVPFYYAVVTVFKSTSDYASGGPLSLPHAIAPIIGNVVAAWQQTQMGTGMANSLGYGVFGAGAAVFFAAMAAYALARIVFPGRPAWFMLIFSGTIFPFQIYLIPLFQMYARVGLFNTRFGLLLAYIAICIPFPTLVLKNYMAEIPRELDEAARIDGGTHPRIFASIILPNCIGPLVALFLLQFTWIWNDLIFSMVLTQDTSRRSVMNTLMVFQGNYAGSTPNLVITAAVLASLPTVLVFLVLRRYFMQGLSLSTAR